MSHCLIYSSTTGAVIELKRHSLLHLFLFRDTCMLVRRWRSSDCRWLTVVAMATRAGSASFHGIRTAAGTGPGGSASPSRLDTTSRLGMMWCHCCLFLHEPTTEERTLISNFKNTLSLQPDLKHKYAIKEITSCVLTDNHWPRGDETCFDYEETAVQEKHDNQQKCMLNEYCVSLPKLLWLEWILYISNFKKEYENQSCAVIRLWLLSPPDIVEWFVSACFNLQVTVGWCEGS